MADPVPRTWAQSLPAGKRALLWLPWGQVTLTLQAPDGVATHWLQRFQAAGLAGLKAQPRGRSAWRAGADGR